MCRRPGARAKRGNPGPMNTVPAILLSGCPWVPGSRTAPAHRNDDLQCSVPPKARGGIKSAPQLAPALRQRAQAQRVEPDEPLRIVLVIGDAVLERHQLPIVERIGALAADHRGLALVELEPHPAGHELLAEID